MALVACTAGLALAACTRDCKNINISAWADNNGVTFDCYTYTNSARSCWTCGTNAPGNGFCDLGDPNLNCTRKSRTIQYLKWGFCGQPCNPRITSAYVEARDQAIQRTGRFDEPLYLCDVPSR